jgi:RNA polymerase sigma-70 factor, ECF subfamily
MGDVRANSDAMDRTSETLLDRVRAHDQASWDRFVGLYSPLVFRWCTQAKLQEADALDVGQEVFRAVANKMGSYHHDKPGDTFRGWLYRITLNKLRDFVRRLPADRAKGGAAPDLTGLPEEGADSSSQSAHDDRLLVYRRAVELLLADVEEQTRQAFWRVVVEGDAPKEVAAQLGLTLNAVYLIKSRLLRRLRQEFAGCIDL